MDPATGLLIMLLGGKWRPAGAKPPELLIFVDLRFPGEATGLAALRAMEGHGQIVEMIDFTGESVQVIYKPNPVRPRQWELALPAGAAIRSVRPIERK